MSIRIAFDWVEASPSTDQLAQSTMAALTIEVDGRPVTSVLDRRSRSCRDHVIVPLVYVAEWLVGNWWRLLYEVEDERTPRLGFAEAHDMSYVGEGFLLPRLTISPTPDRVRLRWASYRPAHSEIEFTEQGEAIVDRPELQGAVQRVVEATLARLDGLGLAAEFLQRDWAAIQSTDSDERTFCRAAALLGVDPFAVPQPLADQIVDFWRCVEPAIREDALATANRDGLAPLADWLTDALECLSASAGGGGWADMRATLPAPSAPQPFQRGFELAQAVRAELAPGSGRYEFPATGREALALVELEPPSSSVQGVVAANSPACAMRVRGVREDSRRFLRARALGDYLGRREHTPAILTGLATDRQSQSRAFAAEFLVPEAALRQRLRHDQVHADEVDDLAAVFGVSSYVIRHQIQNHGLANITEW